MAYNYGITPESLSWGNLLTPQVPAIQAQPMNLSGLSPGQDQSILSRIASYGTENGQMLGGLLSGAGSLWGAYNSGQQLGLAKDAFGLQKRAFETNLANSIASYNTALEDRIRGRSSNPNENEVNSYLAAHRLKG